MAISIKEIFGINELRGNNLWRAILAEFLGTYILNFFGCFSCAQKHNDIVQIALGFGLSVFMAVMTIGHVSGGHINPAVTCGMMAAGKVKLIRGFLYILAQCIGAIAGTGSLRALIGGEHGITKLSVDPLNGLGIEFLLGFILIFCVFGVCDDNKPDHRFMAPLAIGLTVTLGHLGAVEYTGSSMNPARTFGTSVINNHWDNHWVYWVGPILGAVAAALLYTQALHAPEPEISISEKYRTNANEKEMRRLDTKSDFA